MAAPRRFTDKYLSHLKAGPARVELTDSTGLMVRVSPRGVRSFWWVHKADGKTHREALGIWHEDDPHGLTLAQASAKLARLRAAAATPGRTRGAGRVTVADLVDEFQTIYLDRNRERPWEARYLLVKDVVPRIGDRLIGDVTARMLVTEVIDPILARGAPVHAGRVLTLVKQMLGFAVGRGLLPVSPAAALTIKATGARLHEPGDRALADPEIAALWRFIDRRPGPLNGTLRLPEPTAIAIQILLLTGVRGIELRSARWTDVDLAAGVWTIPKTKTSARAKARARSEGRPPPPPHRVPLVPAVVARLDRLQRLSEGSEWVLPAAGSAAKPTDSKWLTHVGARLRGRVLLPDGTPIAPWSIHDLRRTFRSGLARLGVPPHVAEVALGHSLGRIAAVYDRHDYFSERGEALERWARHVLGLVGTDQEGA